jgi:hypothetical protein
LKQSGGCGKKTALLDCLTLLRREDVAHVIATKQAAKIECCCHD